MKKPNDDIRDFVKGKHIPMWKVADSLGIADTTLCRRLRHELPEAEKEKIFSIIQELSQEVI